MSEKLSVVIPARDEEEMIPVASETILHILDDADIPCELVFVDDGSSDGTWAAVLAAARKDRRVRGIRFSRNFGKEAALLAGLRYAGGGCCVTIDCDLQHPPEKIPEMYALWRQGFEVVEGVKADRGKESPLHRAAVGVFYRMMSGAAGMEMRNRSDFKLLGRRAVDALLAMPEQDTFYRALSGWVGFPSASVSFEVAPRRAGTSKWSTVKLIRYAVRNLTSFTAAPMGLVTLLGVMTLLAALLFGVWTLTGHGTADSAVIFTVLLIGSLILLSLGMMGVYLSKVFEEVKGRPRYLVSETTDPDVTAA